MFGKYEINGWKEAHDIVGSIFHSSPKWIFRGQPCADKPLSTSLERTADNLWVPFGYLPIIERQMLDEFTRTAHHYLKYAPDDKDYIEWLSILQHHGGVTRLLDFTHSFYIAMYFAIESSMSDASVWCINKEALASSLLDKQNKEYESSSDLIFAADIYKDQMYGDGIDTANMYIGKKDITDNFVILVSPYRINERMAIQQGIFLFPSNITISFQTNLCNTFGEKSMTTIDDNINVSNFDKYSVVKLIIPKVHHKEILLDLKKMNITAASLFPGLDGYARSLKYHCRLLEEAELRAILT